MDRNIFLCLFFYKAYETSVEENIDLSTFA